MTMTHYHEVAAKYGVTIKTTDREDNPWYVGHTLPDSHHYDVVLSRGVYDLDVVFTTGSAWTEPPSAGDVLVCLKADQSWDEVFGDFEDFCYVSGVNVPDPDEWPELYAVIHGRYREVCAELERQSESLKILLGDRFDEFMDDEDVA